MNQIFKNATVPEIISGMESKFYTVFNRYNNTGNLSITLYNFKAQCQEWGYKNPLTRLVALFS